MDYMISSSTKINCCTIVEERTIDSSIGRVRVNMPIDSSAWMGYQSTGDMLGKPTTSTKNVKGRLAVVVGNSNSLKLAYDKMSNFGVFNFRLATVEKPNLAWVVFSLWGQKEWILNLWLIN